MSCPSGTRLRIYGLRIGRPGQFRVHRHNSLIPFMARLAHHERLGWLGSPRMGGWAGMSWSRSGFDWLTTNGWIGWAYHERVGWVGSSGMGRDSCFMTPCPTNFVHGSTGSPRTAGLGGLTTNGWVGWAYHELVDWVGSPRTAGLGGLTANGWVGWAHHEWVVGRACHGPVHGSTGSPRTEGVRAVHGSTGSPRTGGLGGFTTNG
jgi:hypothetical protein